VKKQEMAFPSEALGQTGMTLRDWFAGMVLQSLMYTVIKTELLMPDFVELAYKTADQMLKERNK
jgi:hypothetical protein